MHDMESPRKRMLVYCWNALDPKEYVYAKVTGRDRP